MTVQTSTITSQTVGTVLSALTAELALAAQSCGHLDDAMGEILEATPPELRMTVMQQLHTVDMLAQRITAIADFVNKLADSAQSEAVFDLHNAIAAVTLGEVAERLKANTQEALAA
jgi:hypothetical protein